MDRLINRLIVAAPDKPSTNQTQYVRSETGGIGVCCRAWEPALFCLPREALDSIPALSLPFLFAAHGVMGMMEDGLTSLVR